MVRIQTLCGPWKRKEEETAGWGSTSRSGNGEVRSVTRRVGKKKKFTVDPTSETSDTPPVSGRARRCTILGGSRCALARHGSSQAPPLEFAFFSARFLFGFAKLTVRPRLKLRASAELDRSSPWSPKQALMFRTSRRSSQLPWPPKPPHHAQSHKLFDNCSPHLINRYA